MGTTAPADPRLAADAAAFRRFNRNYTRFIGTLNEGLLRTEFNLVEARILYELAHRTRPQASGISDALQLDPGYLSRILAKFEKAGLLRREVSKQDSRAADLLLTAKGRAAFKSLNARSENEARSLLKKLPLPERVQLVDALQTVERIVLAPAPASRDFVLRSHRPGDMGWVVQSEGAGYAQQFGWDMSFEALVARIVADFLLNFDSRRERCWIADVDGRSMGHVFLVKHPEDPQTAKLRLLFVDPAARGLGIGQALVAACIQFARDAGYRKITLWTQSILVAAHRIYQSAGFRLVREEPHHSFGQELVGQTWELDLGATQNGTAGLFAAPRATPGASARR